MHINHPKESEVKVPEDSQVVNLEKKKLDNKPPASKPSKFKNKELNEPQVFYPLKLKEKKLKQESQSSE